MASCKTLCASLTYLSLLFTGPILLYTPPYQIHATMPKNPFSNQTFHKHIDCLNIRSTALICLFWPSASPCEIQSWHEDHCRCWSHVFVQLMSFSQSHLELGNILLLQHLSSENLRKMKATLLRTTSEWQLLSETSGTCRLGARD